MIDARNKVWLKFDKKDSFVKNNPRKKEIFFAGYDSALREAEKEVNILIKKCETGNSVPAIWRLEELLESFKRLREGSAEQ